MAQNHSQVELLICTRCRRGQEMTEDAERPGAALYRHVSEAGIDGVSVTPVECLSNCSQGCTVALRGPGRWTYIYGRCEPGAHLEVVREGAAKYAASADGLVPWRERPEHFRKNCIARIPPLRSPEPGLGET